MAGNSLMQIVQNTGFLIGPALAGFSIGLWGAQVAFLVDSAAYFVSAAAILAMTVPRTTAGRQATSGQLATVWGEIREGIGAIQVIALLVLQEPEIQDSKPILDGTVG